MTLPVINPHIAITTLMAKHASSLNLSPLAWPRRHALHFEERVPLLPAARVCPAAGGFGDVALRPACFQVSIQYLFRVGLIL